MSEIVQEAKVRFPHDFGFCEGVVAADDLLRRVAIEAKAHGIDNIYGYHDVVHNHDVVAEHEANGVIFVNNLDNIPVESIVVTSAHGVGPEVVFALESRNSLVFDAACPLVLHTHAGVKKAREAGEKVIYVCQGKPGEVPKLHDEVEGVIGHLNYELIDGQLIESPVERSYLELSDDPAEISNLLTKEARYRIISQTTLHADQTFDYRKRLRAWLLAQQPEASVAWSKPGDVCRAVTKRQEGVEELIQLQPGRLVVVTDPKSKNGMGYVHLAERRVVEEGLATEVVAVANADEAQQLAPIDGLTGLTASASTPDRTTFSVAKELGLIEVPSVERKSFMLKDARGNNIQMKISSFAAAVALKSVSN